MMKKRNFAVIGAACGYGAQKHGCQDAPEVLQSFGFLEHLNEMGISYYWDDIIHLSPDHYRAPLSSVSIFSRQLSVKVREAR